MAFNIDLVLRVLNDSMITISEGDPTQNVCLVMELDPQREIRRDISIRILTSMDTASKLWPRHTSHM